jgi:hypothetical protein
MNCLECTVEKIRVRKRSKAAYQSVAEDARRRKSLTCPEPCLCHWCPFSATGGKTARSNEEGMRRISDEKEGQSLLQIESMGDSE